MRFIASLFLVACGGITTGTGSNKTSTLADSGVVDSNIVVPNDLPDMPDDFFEGLWALSYHAGQPASSFGWVRFGHDGVAHFQAAEEMYSVWT